jgi:hypothetical protein
MRLLIPLVVLPAAILGAGCQTPAAPPAPATSSALVGPAPRPGVLQRAASDQPLYPAKEGAGGHDHHHHHAPAPAPAPTPGPGGAR